MFLKHKVSAYGSVAGSVNSFQKGDYVLYYHKGYGVVGAGKIKSDTKENKEYKRDYELFREVELLTPEISKIEDIRYISYSELCELLNNPCGSPTH